MIQTGNLLALSKSNPVLVSSTLFQYNLLLNKQQDLSLFIKVISKVAKYWRRQAFDSINSKFTSSSQQTANYIHSYILNLSSNLTNSTLINDSISALIIILNNLDWTNLDNSCLFSLLDLSTKYYSTNHHFILLATAITSANNNIFNLELNDYCISYITNHSNYPTLDACLSLLAINKSTDISATLIDLIKNTSHPPLTRQTAFSTYLTYSIPSLDFVFYLLADPNLQIHALKYLSTTTNPPTKNLVAIIISLMVSDNVSISSEAIGTAGSLIPFINDELFIHDLIDILPSLLKTQNEQVRIRSSWTIANISALYPIKIELILQLCKDIEKVCVNGVRALGNYSKFNPTSQEYISILLVHSLKGQYKTRWNSLYALSLHLSQKQSINSIEDRLISCLSCSNTKVVIHAVVCLRIWFSFNELVDKGLAILLDKIVADGGDFFYRVELEREVLLLKDVLKDFC